MGYVSSQGKYDVYDHLVLTAKSIHGVKQFKIQSYKAFEDILAGKIT